MVRIASLIPSATEIAAALGCEDQLVARSHECDFPSTVARLPACTEAKIDTGALSAEIDRNIKRLISDGLSIYRVDSDKLKALDPEVILTQSQCEVCAVSETELREAVRSWLDGKAEVVSLGPDGLDDIWRDIEAVARALGVPMRGRDVVTALKSRMAKVSARCTASDVRPRVACIEWIDPLMAAGNWVPELVAMAGGENLFGTARAHSPWMEWETLKASDPDAIVVMPCGFDIARSRSEMTGLARQSGWRDLTAVTSDKVFLTDGNQYFNRPAPRIADSLEILAEILHPDEFPPAHRGSGWEHF